MTRADQGSKQVSQSQKRLLQKLHINLGHPPRERFLRMLRAAGAHEHVIISYVKNELQCEVCDVRAPARQPTTSPVSQNLLLQPFSLCRCCT